MMIDLYSWATPNGRKISIALEEMELPYTVRLVDLLSDEQFSPDFLKISPNNKIPAIFDHEANLSVFESGAILTFLAEKTGKFLPSKPMDGVKTLEWLNWQVAGFGPALGQLNYFLNRAEEKNPHAIKRFSDEAIRLFDVLDSQLSQNDYVAGAYSIADMAIYPWSSAAYDTIKATSGNSHANVEAWHERVASRPAVQTGMRIPEV